MLDLISQKIISLSHLLHQLVHEQQLETWLSSQTNQISPRQHL
jgi:hypothetical protein